MSVLQTQTSPLHDAADSAETARFYEGYWTHRLTRGDHAARNRVKLRHEQTLDFLLARFPKGATVLDLGCGDGIMGQLLTPRGFHVVGADVSRTALEIAGEHYARMVQVDLDVAATPEELTGRGPTDAGSFDAVACLEVLEHVRTPAANVLRIFSLTRPGGVAVFSFPNLFSYKNRWSFVRGRWPGGYTTYDPREHLQVLELATFKDWVTGAGFRFLKTSITPDLPSIKLLRKQMFRRRGLLNWLAPSLFAMQINVFAERPITEPPK